MATAFTYTNTGEATLNKDSSNSQYNRYYKRSTTVNSPTSYQPFVLNKGVDNHIHLVINDKSRRTADINNVTIKGKLIKRNDQTIVVTKNAIVDSYDDAKITFKLVPGDIANLSPTLYDFAITSINNDGEEFLLSPQLNTTGQFTVEVRDGPLPAMPEVTALTSFTGGAGATDPQYSSATNGSVLKGSRDGLHTVAYHVNATCTGSLKMQGSLATTPTEDDFFDIDGTTFTTDQSTTINSVNFTGNFVWVRAKLTSNTAGSVTKILFNN